MRAVKHERHEKQTLCAQQHTEKKKDASEKKTRSKPSMSEMSESVVNIVEELDENGNVVDFRLENIDNEGKPKEESVDYSEASDELKDLMKEMYIDMGEDVKKEKKEEIEKEKTEKEKIEKEKIEKKEEIAKKKELERKEEIAKREEQVNIEKETQTNKKVAAEKSEKLQKIRDKSLFIPPKRRPKKVNKKIDQSNDLIKKPTTKKVSLKSFASDKSQRETSHAAIEVLPEKNSGVVITEAGKVSEASAKSQKAPESISKAYEIPQNAAQSHFKPEIAEEDILELQLLDEDDANDNKQDNELFQDEFFNEEEMYKRVFPWLKPSEPDTKEVEEEEEIKIEGVDFDEYDEDEDDEDDWRIERPFVPEHVLNYVRNAYGIDLGPNEVEEEDDDIVEISIGEEPTANNVPKKSSMKKKTAAPAIVEVDTPATAARTAKKSVQFSETVHVKKIEPVKSANQDKQSIDKMYKEVFGDDYEKMQTLISKNVKELGDQSNLVAPLEDEELEKEEPEPTFQDIVSDNIVENQVVDTSFTLEDDNRKNKTLTNSVCLKPIGKQNDTEYITKQNTRANKKNRVSRFKQLKLNGSEQIS